MCHPISILMTQNRRYIESPDTIKVNIFFLFIARLPSETGHCYAVFPRVKNANFCSSSGKKLTFQIDPDICLLKGLLNAGAFYLTIYPNNTLCVIYWVFFSVACLCLPRHGEVISPVPNRARRECDAEVTKQGWRHLTDKYFNIISHRIGVIINNRLCFCVTFFEGKW